MRQKHRFMEVKCQNHCPLYHTADHTYAIVKLFKGGIYVYIFIHPNQGPFVQSDFLFRLRSRFSFFYTPKVGTFWCLKLAWKVLTFRRYKTRKVKIVACQRPYFWTYPWNVMIHKRESKRNFRLPFVI